MSLIEPESNILNGAAVGRLQNAPNISSYLGVIVAVVRFVSTTCPHGTDNLQVAQTEHV